MKQLGGLNPYEHLRDSSGISIGSVNRANRALLRTGERISELELPVSKQYHIAPIDETYESLRSRAMAIHQERMQYLSGTLNRFIQDGGIYIEDGGIKSKPSLGRKMEYIPSMITFNRCLDLSRCRIIAKDLQTLYEVMACLKEDFQQPKKFCIRDAMNRYIIPKNGKTIYPAAFVYLADTGEYTKKFQSDGSGGSQVDISTEIQIMTRRVREVSESNRDTYAITRRTEKNGDNSIYNRAMFRAILHDWKEYFTQQKKKR